MSAADQLSMFKPHGTELAALASKHAQKAHALALLAVVQQQRGFDASARVFAAQARDLQEQAEVCEVALQFEQLAGLA